MTVVWPCPRRIAQYISAGRLRPPPQRCPACRRGLRLQGGYQRSIRHAGQHHRIWIWRAYCAPCDTSHALLPDFVVAHHLDTTDTIYAAVTHHPTPDVPPSTQRGWRARFRRNTTTLVSASAATTIVLVGDVTSTSSSLDDTLVRLWFAARRKTDLLPPRWRILNIISGSTWIRDRVNSSWLIVGVYPRPP
jgi:Domain of unknown function (DUF6431)